MEFKYLFKITNYITFEVSYYTLGNNAKPHFATSANKLNKTKTDYERCGQTQNDLLKEYETAYLFYKKWDEFHLSYLSNEKLKELENDIQKLKNEYSFLEKRRETFAKRNDDFSFEDERKLTTEIGDNLEDKMEIVISKKYICWKANFNDGIERPVYLCTIKNKRNKKQFSFEFTQSLAEKHKEPENNQILYSLQCDYCEDVEDFMNELGYENIKFGEAIKIYKCLTKINNDMRRVFEKDQLKLLLDTETN